jgi:hypothetical protein
MVRTFVPAAALVLLAVACTAPADEGATDPASTDAQDIISFPASVFANAKVITFGQTLSNLPFKVSDKFLAVRFQGKAGDRIEAKATPGQGEAILYLSRKVGTKYTNVRAGGQDGAARNQLSFTLAEDDTYFLVFRTLPRADATFEVTLSNASAAGACADAGKLPTPKELAELSGAGTEPKYETPPRLVKVERRTCLYATGCGPVDQTTSFDLPSLTFDAIQNGASWKVKASPGAGGNGSLEVDAAGKFSGKVRIDYSASVDVDARGSLGLTCASVETTVTKVPVDDTTYREWRVVGGAYADTAQKAARPATSAPLAVPTIEPATDEEILALFPRGGTTVNFETPLSNGVSAGGQERSCHPLTSCSPLVAPGACNTSNIVLSYATVRGKDGYALVLTVYDPWSWNQVQVPIEDGVGAYGGATVRVSESQLQLEYPATSTTNGDGVTRESSNRTCTFPIRWR